MVETLDRCRESAGEVGRGDKEVGARQQWRCGGFRRGWAWGGQKMKGFWSINRGNVATLGLNVATFLRVELPMSRR